MTSPGEGDGTHVNELGTKLLGFERVEHVAKSSYEDASMIVLCPSRSEMIHHRVVAAWQGMIWPMNQKRALFIITGAEVGRAYDDMVEQVLSHPELSKWKYVMTLEDDNLPPPDAPIRLMESIQLGPFDAVGGLYFTKGDVNMPMCYGDPHEFLRTGVLDFRPRDVTKAVQMGGVLECNGIAMGCSLYRLDVFRKVPRPWFMTLNDVYEGGAKGFTQDLFFCDKARRVGSRFAVDCRVRVGHLDTDTGTVY